MAKKGNRNNVKALFIVNDFPPIIGGQSVYYYNLCRGLPAESIIVLAHCSLGYKKFDANQQFKIIRRPYLVPIPVVEKLFKIVLPFFYAIPILLREDIRYINCAHVLSTGIVGLLLKVVTGKEYVLYTHSADIMEYQKYPLIKMLLLIVLRHAYKVVANSEYTKARLLDLGVEEQKIIKINPMIDFDRFSRDVDTSDIIQRYGLKGRRIILSVNRLVERKGNDIVIKALTLIKENIPDVLYIIMGDGPYKKRLETITIEEGVKNNVIFISSVKDDDDIVKLYNVCDVFVMLSRELKEKGDAEGFGIVFLEANSAGKPVVGGNSGGIADAVVHGLTGLLVDPLDIKKIADAITLLLTDTEYAKRLGMEGRRRVEQEFDYKCGVRGLDFLFED